MNRWIRPMLAAIVPLALLLTLSAQPLIAQSNGSESSTGIVLVAELSDETISPAAARYLDRTLREARQREAICVVIELDTPGGLLTSTRRIVKRIIGSELPVVVYVSPSGSRAASAGVFVTLSSHVAAMAPGTTIGAAHPDAIAARQQATAGGRAV